MGPHGQIEPQPHPSFFAFLMLLVAWCLGESIPTDDVDAS